MSMNMGSGIGRRRGGRGRAPMAEINVTPFVDVMLVLLIIFMVTAPLLVTGVPVDLPESRANALEQEQEPVQISIDNEGRIFIDDEELSRGALDARLREIAADQNPEDPRQIMLRGDRTLDYGLIMGVMGELNRAGLNRVSLVTTGSSEAP
ncbi:MAG: biopolymer transport protein TolR [Parasphingorhabdus sp.]|mgnify:FL=1|jgi:biopolymer transport protein TolR|uniref:protein TolR n=1 Tax=Parasphingorhabdus sp. TaxID=2709688 RepID=UPI001B673931|nr:protein TolR [Sphingomonadales bacterium]|tara:strand:- start:1075 stop:1527 length:453 start_codon:yes stop_codon:yes gene_type:complete